MAAFSHATVARRLTADRLSSYMAATGSRLVEALALYDWNAEVGSAMYEDIGRLEIVFRNTIDAALVDYGGAQGWPTVWYRRSQLFAGKPGVRAQEDIRAARDRATRRVASEVHGKVIAELTLGFWRFLCVPSYLTSLWVPALAAAFPNHPHRGDPRRVRSDAEDRIQRVHFLRNRIAHHEPIHQRNLQRDIDGIDELTGWICADTRTWLTSSSRSATVLHERP